MMIQFPTAAAHATKYLFPDPIAYMDAPTAYSMVAIVRLENTTDPGERVILGKINSVKTAGWAFMVSDSTTPAYAVEVVHGNVTTSRVNSSTALTIDTTHLIGVSFDGSNADFYLDGVADGTPALTLVPLTNTEDLGLANIAAANLGFTGAMGMILWWDVALTAQDMTDMFNGVIPQPNSLKFWVDMTHPTTSPVNETAQERPSNSMSHSAGGQEIATLSSGIGENVSNLELSGQSFQWVWPMDSNADSFDTTTVQAPGFMSSQLSAELDGLKRVYPALEWTPVSGTTRRYGSEGLRSRSRGLFRPQITSWGQATIATNDESLRLEQTGITVTINDEDGDLTSLIMTNRRNILGSIATIVLTSPALTATSQEFEIFRGRLAEPISYRFGENGREWTLNFQQGFDQSIEARLPFFNPDSHPDAPAEMLGRIIRAIYGRWDSSFIDADGMIECPLIDTVNNNYFVSIGRMFDVPAFWVDSEVNTAPALNFSQVVIYGGIPHTVIHFDEELAAKAIVTADVAGLTYQSNSEFSAPILNPAHQLLHAGANFFRNAWRSEDDPWFTPDSNDFNLASFEEVRNYFDQHGYEGAFILKSQSFQGLVSEVAKDQQVNTFWETALTLRIDDPHFADLYDSLLEHHIEPEQVAEFRADFSQSRMANEISAEYVISESDNTAFQNLTVVDKNASVKNAKPFTLSTNVVAIT